MKLMGKNLLHKLATSESGRHAGAVGAMCAELEAANWSSPSAALSDYPDATLIGHSLEIPMSDGACVRLAINCAAGVVLIEFAG